jgi:hypothetical protein
MPLKKCLASRPNRLLSIVLIPIDIFFSLAYIVYFLVSGKVAILESILAKLQESDRWLTWKEIQIATGASARYVLPLLVVLSWKNQNTGDRPIDLRPRSAKTVRRLQQLLGRKHTTLKTYDPIRRDLFAVEHAMFFEFKSRQSSLAPNPTREKSAARGTLIA